MPNRLADSSSPYLLQHQNNPVDWYPWCAEAFEVARRRDCPIFLSVGYSACHWCHVMEHESFENEQLAATLNEHFVAVKVDREERPDVDQIYMQAIQLLTGAGGWPMSVFLTPDAKPFYGGTYWPPENRWGRPGFGQVLLAVSEAWQHKREQISEQTTQICAYLENACRGPAESQQGLNVAWITKAAQWLIEHHDAQDGGFGGAPKFPHTMDLALLLELHSLQSATDGAVRGSEVGLGDSDEATLKALEFTVKHSLNRMYQGGIYDHLGGGFARYSVDAQWLVPHFEKMLYDNALLATLYADAFRCFGDPDYAVVVRETLDYLLREMCDAEGGFYSAEDADSEGVEGKYYVWTPDEVIAVLGAERGERFCARFDVTSAGNFEGQSILHPVASVAELSARFSLPEARLREELEQDRCKLLQQRSERVRPGLDDKVLLSWNALAITAFVHGYRALNEPRYLAAAYRARDFLWQAMRCEDGRLWHSWRRGQATLNAYLDDYAYLIDALTELYQADGRADVLRWASELGEIVWRDFRDEQGGFYFTAHDHEALITRSRDLADSSVPSGNSMVALGFLKLGRLTGREAFTRGAEEALMAASGVMEQTPQAAGQALRALLWYSLPPAEWIFFPRPCGQGVGDGGAAGELAGEFLRRFQPAVIQVYARHAEENAAASPLLANRSAVDSDDTLYVCSGGVCQRPLVGSAIAAAWSR